MPAPVTTDDFATLVERSGVLSKAVLDRALERLRSEGVPMDTPRDLAQALVAEHLLTRFHAEQLLAGRHKGFIVGKYKILSLLGSGGMGRVFLAEHSIMRRQVALKVLPKTKSTDPSAIGRFQREARAVASLNHPNIVQAYDIDSTGDLHYIVMEYVEGISIQDQVRQQGPIAWPEAAEIVRQAADGLEHANQSGLVHRDIKPGNLLVDTAGVVKILDMGLAMFFTEKEQESITRTYDENVLGTADYLAPEQALDSHAVDTRADIYSLGGTFYYMLTGQAPFPDGTIAQKLLWHQNRMPRPVEELVPDLPPELAAIVTKMLSKRPEDRFATPGDLEVALRPFAQATAPVSVEQPRLASFQAAGKQHHAGADAMASDSNPPADDNPFADFPGPDRGQESEAPPGSSFDDSLFAPLGPASGGSGKSPSGSGSDVLPRPKATGKGAGGTGDSTQDSPRTKRDGDPAGSPTPAPSGSGGTSMFEPLDDGADDGELPVFGGPGLPAAKPTAPKAPATKAPATKPASGRAAAPKVPPPAKSAPKAAGRAPARGQGSGTAAPESADGEKRGLPVPLPWLLGGIGGGLALLLVLGFGVWALLPSPGPETPPEKAETTKPKRPTYGADVLTVASEGSKRKAKFAFIDNAFAEANDGQTIMLLDRGPWEPFAIRLAPDGFFSTKDLTLAAEERATKLVFSAANPDGAYLSLDRIPAFTVQNLTLATGGTKGPILSLEGSTATLEDVTLQAQGGDVLVRIVGEQASSLTLRGVRFEGAFATGLLIDAPVGKVDIEGCTFTSGEVALRFTAKATRGTVTVRDTDFGAVQTAIERADPTKPTVRLEKGNTGLDGPEEPKEAPPADAS